MDFAYVDKLAKENNGVKYLLVRQNLFDRTVIAKVMKTNDSQVTVNAFSPMITRKNQPKKIWVDKGIQVYSTMRETKAAFAERTIPSERTVPTLKIFFTVVCKTMDSSM